jgi:hypothetical protein
MKTCKKAFTAILLPIILLLLSVSSYSQRSDRVITATEQNQIVDKAFTLLRANYIFPDILPKLEKEIFRKLKEGAYVKFATAEEFLKNINTDLETLSGDRHINIFFDPIRVKQLEAEANGDQKKPGYGSAFLQRAKFENYMLRKVERLDGNVGYFKFNAFVDTALSKKALVAAMNLLENSTALIVDLRQNGGGDAKALSFLFAYFLPDSTLLSMGRSRTTKALTSHYLSGDRDIKKISKNVPVYILVSKRTSSAAEAFAYTLQSYKRATVIGEVTNGEANPGYLFPLNSEMYIMIPAFDIINPITKTNWQGKGVMPDVQILSDKALTMAQATAYETLAQKVPVPELKNMYAWMSIGLQAELQPVTLAEKEIKTLAGEFADGRHVSYTNGALYYYRGENANSKKKLVPLKTDVFGVEGVPFFRVRFIKNEKGDVEALEGFYDDGKIEISKKIH